MSGLEKPKRRERIRRALGRLVGVYLDDLLLCCGGVCFTAGAYLRWGTATALLVLGLCLIAYAVIVARGGMGGR